MKITPLISALQGIQRSMKDADRHAAQIASRRQAQSGESNDLTEPLVGLTKDRAQAQASAKAVHAVDDMIGTLLDEKA